MINNIIDIVKDNQFLLAGLGLSGAGLITFWLKDVPIKIGSFFKRQLMTDLIIHNYDLVFYDVLKWIKTENKNKNFRTLKLNNGRWGGNTNINLTMGYGFHIVWYKTNIFFINFTKADNTLSDKYRETIVITKFGRGKNLFEELIKDIETKDKDKSKLKLFKMDDCWNFNQDFRKRALNSIFLEKTKKDLIFNNLDKFIQNEDWYLKSGIPYQYGILLYGQPGTGKTSLIKAIASKLDYDIYYLTPAKMYRIEKALNTCSEKSIVVIEDIDTNNIVHERNKGKKEDLFSTMEPINFSDILNSIDGLGSVHGRLLICTTNHLEQLDKALIRPGRFDLLVEIGNVNKEILKQFLEFYFPNNKIKLNNIRLKKNITVAQLQNFVLLGNNCNEILKKASVK